MVSMNPSASMDATTSCWSLEHAVFSSNEDYNLLLSWQQSAMDFATNETYTLSLTVYVVGAANTTLRVTVEGLQSLSAEVMSLSLIILGNDDPDFYELEEQHISKYFIL